MADDSEEIFFKSFMKEAVVSSSGMGRDVLFFFYLFLAAFSSADHGVAHPKRCLEGWLWRHRPSWRGTCPNWKWLLGTHKDDDLAPHPVVDLVRHVGDTKKFPHAQVGCTSR